MSALNRWILMNGADCHWRVGGINKGPGQWTIWIYKQSTSMVKKCSHAVLMPHEYDTVALKVLFVFVQCNCVSPCTARKKKKTHLVSLTTYLWSRATPADVPGSYFTLQKLIVSLKPWKKIMKKRGCAFIIDAGMYCNTRLPKETHEKSWKIERIHIQFYLIPSAFIWVY